MAKNRPDTCKDRRLLAIDHGHLGNQEFHQGLCGGEAESFGHGRHFRIERVYICFPLLRCGFIGCGPRDLIRPFGAPSPTSLEKGQVAVNRPFSIEDGEGGPEV